MDFETIDKLAYFGPISIATFLPFFLGIILYNRFQFNLNTTTIVALVCIGISLVLNQLGYAHRHWLATTLAKLDRPLSTLLLSLAISYCFPPLMFVCGLIIGYLNHYKEKQRLAKTKYK